MPFDLEYWYVQVLAGDATIFLALAFFAITMIAAKFQMPYVVTIMSFLLFVMMFNNMTLGLGVVFVLFVGIIGGWTIARIMKT